jgi:hypothetical protein
MTLTPDTRRAVRELAEAMDIEPEEVIARGVKALAILRATLWVSSPVNRTTGGRIDTHESEDA